MSQPAPHVLLNRLLAIVGRSFPQYLLYSRPYVPPGQENKMEAISAIVDDQNGMVARLSQMVADAQAPPRFGEFPIEYADRHDLDINFLLGLATKYQEQDIASISEIAEQLQLAPAAQSLAEEVLGMAKGHLDSLTELLPEATSKS